MSSARKVDDYVAAVRHRNSLVDAIDTDIPGYWTARKAAVTKVKELERTLTGGELGRARRLLAAGC